MAQEPPILDDEAQALKKHKRRIWSMGLFFAIFSLPVFIGLYLVIRSHRTIAAEQAWAVAELAKPNPAPAAYGVRGAGLLSDGKAQEALPLLDKAAELEAAAGPKVGVKALVMLIEAQVMLGAKVPAQELLKLLEQRATQLAQGPQAAAWHAAGKLHGHLGEQKDAVRCLQKAVELQPDDWVQSADGQKYKHRGIASIYKKDLAGAALD